MTHQQKIIVAGGGGQAKVLLGVLLRMPQYEVVGFLDDNEKVAEIFGVPKVGKLTSIDSSLETKVLALGLGHVGNTTFYKKIIDLYTKAGFSFESIVAPTACVSAFATIGKGVAIADGAIIQPFAKIGDYAIVNTNASVDHDSTIGEYTHIAPGVAISGGVIVGHSCLLGTGASVIQGVTITDECVIGAGAAVVKNCEKSGTYVGVPAKLLEKNSA